MIKYTFLLALFLLLTGIAQAQDGDAVPTTRFERMGVLRYVDFATRRVTIGETTYPMAPGIKWYGLEPEVKPEAQSHRINRKRVGYILSWDTRSPSSQPYGLRLSEIKTGVLVHKRKTLGFTLVELMITIAIISILVSIGYPMYQDQVYKSRRVAARGSLLELAQFMERNYTEANRYNEFADGNTLNTDGLPFDNSPKEGGTAYYDLTLTATDTAYVLQAAPTAAQSGDECGTLMLSSNGNRTATGSGSNCW